MRLKPKQAAKLIQLAGDGRRRLETRMWAIHQLGDHKKALELVLKLSVPASVKLMQKARRRSNIVAAA